MWWSRHIGLSYQTLWRVDIGNWRCLISGRYSLRWTWNWQVWQSAVHRQVVGSYNEDKIKRSTVVPRISRFQANCTSSIYSCHNFDHPQSWRSHHRKRISLLDKLCKILKVWYCPQSIHWAFRESSTIANLLRVRYRKSIINSNKQSISLLYWSSCWYSN